MVEAAVKILKKDIQKALRVDIDLHLTILKRRNTPTGGMQSRPVQRLMSRRTRSVVPTKSTLLHPQVLERVPEKIKKKRQEAKFWQDQHAKELPELQIGEPVRVRTLGKYQQRPTWTPRMCAGKESSRSYIVEEEGGLKR